MPLKSAKQQKLMYAAASGKLKGAGPSPEVAKEFIHKTPKETRKKFGKVK